MVLMVLRNLKYRRIHFFLSLTLKLLVRRKLWKLITSENRIVLHRIVNWSNYIHTDWWNPCDHHTKQSSNFRLVYKSGCMRIENPIASSGSEWTVMFSMFKWQWIWWSSPVTIPVSLYYSNSLLILCLSGPNDWLVNGPKNTKITKPAESQHICWLYPSFVVQLGFYGHPRGF